MKVCTDACLFAAWLAAETATAGIKTALDIGTGTGLLTLMLAQKINAVFDAVEIDHDAAEQARQNIAASPWNDRISIHKVRLQQFHPATRHDLIFSNPPFYKNDLKSADQQRNTALHSQQLGFEELLSISANLLNNAGLLALLIPFSRFAEMKNLAAAHGLFIMKEVHVRQSENHDFFRSMLLMGRHLTSTQSGEIVIKVNGEYSEEFRHLLQDYYLYL